ncbi:chaperone modulator CbpM [Arcticibacterium luteifluviistationis]|uniref:MerR family transcriptional regulator n=1 Tax=Arcticibacterium luteifluviistationis TaxID=1784714 RepID=A0A2Z4GDW7_9BACT|nr:chaperone modulator CbpM [Arcticibacterium luteifluviistationis]AWV99509.1 MerR family transcriptional regulator [Arcticibacterium luteifluviistationis]
METDKFIRIDHFCEVYEIELSFIEELVSYELISITEQESVKCFLPDDIPHIEKMIRLYKELDINPAGIDAILLLLEKLNKKESELTELKSRLSIFLK